MRKLSFFIVLILAIVACNDKAASKIKLENLEKAHKRDMDNVQKAVAVFDTTEYDFGTIKEGDKAKGVFKITNSGNKPLIIYRAKGSCGCTVPEPPKNPIMPGATDTIAFTFDSKGRTGSQSKTIRLKTNTETGSEKLRIKGIVTSK